MARTPVLILVLMEDALVRANIIGHIHARIVLILVLMEDALVRFTPKQR